MPNIYSGKKVFLTGHSGFKGGWLALWLESLGASVLGYSLAPDTELYGALDLEKHCKSVWGDIRNREKLMQTMKDFAPDMIFHLAAQPLVRLSYTEPFLTYETNVMGTLNVLESARNCQSVKAFVNVTTDKCYENVEKSQGYREDEPMGGHDMYSSSKGCVEIMSASYRRSFLTDSYAMATARAGNVIGGGDWAKDRLVADCVRAIRQNKPIEIRNPLAVRPWQHVLEPLSGYLLLGKKLMEGGHKYAQGFNFGPNSVVKVADVAQKIVDCYGEGEVIVHRKYDLHEANLLMLNVDKAEKVLGWKPCYNVDTAIEKTVEWYKRFYNGENMAKFTRMQIEEFYKSER